MIEVRQSALKTTNAFKQIAGNKTWDQLTADQQKQIYTMAILEQSYAKFGNTMEKNSKTIMMQFNAQLQNTKLALGNVGKTIWTAVAPAITSLLAIVERAANAFAKLMSSILAVFGIKTDFSKTFKGTDTASQKVADNTSDTADNIDDATDSQKKFNKAQQGALMGFDEINQLSRNEADNVEDNASNKMKDLEAGNIVDNTSLDEANSKLDEMANKLKNIMKEIAQPFKDAWNNMGDWFKSKLEFFKTSFRDMVESIKSLCADLWENGLKTIVQHFAELAIAIGGAMLEIYGVMFNSIGKLAEYLKPSNNPITKNMLEAIDTLLVALRDFFMGLGKGFQDFMDNGISKFAVIKSRKFGKSLIILNF